MITDGLSMTAYKTQDVVRPSILLSAAMEVEGVLTHVFKDLRQAKSLCLKSQKAIGVTRENNNFVVYCTRKGPPYKMQICPLYMTKGKWIYLKAYYKGTNIMCNLKNAIHKTSTKGRIRDSYILENDFTVKLIHHTCIVLNKKKLCKNCKQPNNHAKCLKGIEYYALFQ